MIRTRSLQAAYPGGAALRFPDADVPQGGRLLLQGASGTGKSTWLALVAGLLQPQAGELVVAGEAIARLSQRGRDRWRGRSIGVLPQKLHLAEALTVHDNLALAFFAAGVPHDSAAIRRALEALGVAGLAQRRPAQLSGGQAQRVALARAILLAPKVILADEPTASLDDTSCAAALGLLDEAARRCGATLVVATHDRRVREALAGAQVLALPGHPRAGGDPVSSAAVDR